MDKDGNSLIGDSTGAQSDTNEKAAPETQQNVNVMNVHVHQDNSTTDNSTNVVGDKNAVAAGGGDDAETTRYAEVESLEYSGGGGGYVDDEEEDSGGAGGYIEDGEDDYGGREEEPQALTHGDEDYDEDIPADSHVDVAVDELEDM
jgi:hypothetical protein